MRCRFALGSSSPAFSTSRPTSGAFVRWGIVEVRAFCRCSIFPFHTSRPTRLAPFGLLGLFFAFLRVASKACFSPPTGTNSSGVSPLSKPLPSNELSSSLFGKDVRSPYRLSFSNSVSVACKHQSRPIWWAGTLTICSIMIQSL